MRTDHLRDAIKEKYARAASAAGSGAQATCGCNCDCGPGTDNPITVDLYSATELGTLPAEAAAASLGCGNPTALATLQPGEVVLDLGSGGGIDVLLSAARVGPAGKAYGLDMTDEMLELARENARKAGAANVEFLKGEIESIPLPDGSVDVIVSNCVINLSADKDRVLREAFRVLKPGGRLAVSDIVVRGEVPTAVRHSIELWAGCVSGALEESDYAAKLAAAGFEAVVVDPWRVYNVVEAGPLLAQAGISAADIAAVDGKFASAFISAVKPRSI